MSLENFNGGPLSVAFEQSSGTINHYGYDKIIVLIQCFWVSSLYENMTKEYIYTNLPL